MSLETTTTDLGDGIEQLKGALLDAQSVGVKLQTLQSVAELGLLRTCSLLERFLQELFYLSMLGQSGQDGVG